MSAQGNSAGFSKGQVVFLLSRASRCHACDRKLVPGEIVKLQESKEDREALCRKCAGLDLLEILYSGNAQITRLSKKYSSISFVIMKWSDAWKCYERAGLLVEPQAIDRAERESNLQAHNREQKQRPSPS